MMEFQEKRKIRRFLYSKITVAVLITLIFFILIEVWDVYKKQSLTKDNLAKTAAVLEGLKGREKMLSSEIERLKTEGGTEAEIREKFGLVKPGEEVLVIVSDEVEANPKASSSVGFWQKIVNWFK